jgi:lysophospholipid acyltransferase (LPLAT)-like uncharacterized protein
VKIRSRWVTKAAAFCGVYALRLLFATCRKRFIGKVLEDGLKKLDDPENADYYVLCVWHDALLLPTFAANKPLRRRCCCLVSKHRDGSYLADAMSLMDYKTVRGSSQRGGTEAIRELLTETAGRHIIITPDGPQGPRRKLKHGAAFLASQMGRGLLPGAFVVNRGWRIRGTWTDMVIPLPFSTIYLITGDPILVPPDIPRPELMRYLEKAQQAMDELNDAADRTYAGGPAPQFVAKIKQKAA